MTISTGPSTPGETWSSSTEDAGPGVALLGNACGPHHRAAASLLARFGLTLTSVPARAPIPGTYWGEPEAGLRGLQVFVHDDTPVHSMLHEACHAICMDPHRLAGLDTDAGGDPLEECAVCYLSILLAEHLPGLGRERMLADMDAWGYSFRLGSARAWFEGDADDARSWLTDHALIDADGRVAWRRRADATR